MKKILMVAVSFIGLFSLTGCTQHLEGSYSTKLNLFFVEATDTLKFDGDKVIETDPDGKTKKGTYEISENQLKMNIEGHNTVAELSKDKKTFEIKEGHDMFLRSVYTKNGD